MKKTIAALAIVFLSSMTAQAQTGAGMVGGQVQSGQGKMGQQMPMMEHMMGHGMMMQNMMQMMADMMKIQQKMIEGVTPAEKEKMKTDLSLMIEKMDKMMVDMKGMMSQGMMMQEMMSGMSGTTQPEQKGGPQKIQEKSEAGVTAKIAPVSSNAVVKFKVTLETHSLDLDGYQFDQIVVLRAGGKEYKGQVVTQEGSGHHRSAIIEFDNPGTKGYEVVIKDVAGVKERIFRFPMI